MAQGLFSTSESVDLAPLIDHSLLVPTATPDQVAQWCDEADRYGFAAVCVYPAHVRQAAERLYQRSAKVCTVIGFPTGAPPRPPSSMRPKRRRKTARRNWMW